MANTESSVTKSLLIFGILFIGAIAHIFQWNEYSFEIIPLKVKEIIGQADKKDFLEIARICEARKNESCIEISLTNALLKDPIDKELLHKVAKIKMERKLYKDTVRLMAEYFRLGGKGSEQRYLLAEALFNSGDGKTAAQHLRYILFSSKERVHPDVPRLYVKVLMKNRQWNDAKQAILYYRRNVKNASYFLEKELKEIQKNLQGKRS